MNVIELNERLRYEVQSTTLAGARRLVDMAEFEGNGCCSCWKFARMIRPQLEKHVAQWRGKPGTYIPEDRHQCEHIRAVIIYIANRLIQHVRLQYPDDNQKV